MEDERDIVGGMLDLLGSDDVTDTRVPALRTILRWPCAPTDGVIAVADTRVLQVFMVLQIDGEQVLVHAINDDQRTIEVDRGFGGSRVTGHLSDAPVIIVGVAMPAMTGG